jgi:hypothetical protein
MMNTMWILDSQNACGTKSESQNYVPENITQRWFNYGDVFNGEDLDTWMHDILNNQRNKQRQ